MSLLAGTVLSVILVVVVMPRYVRHAATQKPADVAADQFVTAPAPDTNLGQRVEQSLQQNSDANSPAQPTSEPFNSTSPENQSAEGAQNFVPQQNNSQGQETTTPQGTPPTDNPQTNPSDHSTPPQNNQPTSVPAPSAAIPIQNAPSGPKAFNVKVSEHEVSGLIYNGVMQRTLPAYRPALKGVATQIQNGTAKITVALEPRYLPDDMLRNFPGIDRSSPTIYVGGEVGLRFDQNTVYPDIQNVSLGSLRIPTAIIKSLIKYEIHQQIRNMIQLGSGQQVQLKNVNLSNGALSIEGQVQSF